jgi:NADPH-dependent glutamate synthase beta subunit-like oxidoreductase
MPDKKLIDFEKLKEIRYLCSKCDKLVCEKFGCPIWNSLPDAEYYKERCKELETKAKE